MHLLKAMQNKLKLWFIEGKFNEENDMKLVLTIWFVNFENSAKSAIYIYMKCTIYILPTQLYNRRSKCSYSIEKKNIHG